MFQPSTGSSSGTKFVCVKVFEKRNKIDIFFRLFDSTDLWKRRTPTMPTKKTRRQIPEGQSRQIGDGVQVSFSISYFVLIRLLINFIYYVFIKLVI